MAERLTRVPRVREVEISFPKDAPNLAHSMTRRWAPPTRYTLRRNTASIMKGLVLFFGSTVKLNINLTILLKPTKCMLHKR